MRGVKKTVIWDITQNNGPTYYKGTDVQDKRFDRQESDRSHSTKVRSL